MNRRTIAIAAAILAGIASVASARPGGGESYSGGGGHGGGGHGGSGGGGGGAIFELIYWTFRMCIFYPQVGVPLVGGVLAIVLYSAYKQHQNKDWDSGPPVELQRAVELTELGERDPEFSQVVFEDFVFRLFSTAQRVRATAAGLATVAPYVSAQARAELAAREPVGQPVVQVIVGALRVVSADIPPPSDAADARVAIAVELETNVATATHTYYSVETWLFGRAASRHSKPPGANKTFPCPNCGAPWQASASGTQVCASCGQAVDNGRFDWVVDEISVASMDERPPTLTQEVPERGTDLPTYLQDGVDARWAELVQADPTQTPEALHARLAVIYNELNKSWSLNELAPIRGFVSDGLFDYLQYWVDAYKRQGLRNALTEMRITNVELAKVSRDKWYDAVTLRVWGTGKDYVVRGDTGAVVRGSKHRERAYSEYWTLIRSAQRKGPARGDAACSNCGAPLHVGMSGACDHCGAHVTAGEFDWVLSKIEQDDTYRG